MGAEMTDTQISPEADTSDYTRRMIIAVIILFIVVIIVVLIIVFVVLGCSTGTRSGCMEHNVSRHTYTGDLEEVKTSLKDRLISDCCSCSYRNDENELMELADCKEFVGTWVDKFKQDHIEALASHPEYAIYYAAYF